MQAEVEFRMKGHDVEDDQWMVRAAQGDTQAFGRLVERHQGRLTRFAERMLGDREAAADAVQEAFLRLWRSRAHYQAQGQMERLLLRVVRNICLDRARMRTPPESLDSLPEAANPIEGPASDVQSKVFAEAVRQAILCLPETQRVVFVLTHYEGLTYREVASILQCPLGTVASRKLAAVATLRLKLHDWNE